MTRVIILFLLRRFSHAINALNGTDLDYVPVHLARNANVIVSTLTALSREGHCVKKKKGTMSWLRSSPLRTSFSKQRSRDSPPKDADPSACYDSFCKHSQQIYEIILHSLVRATIFRPLVVLSLRNLHFSPNNASKRYLSYPSRQTAYVKFKNIQSY